MQQKKIEAWKIIPTSDNTISLVGQVNGQAVQTSPIKLFRRGEIQTQNTHYLLGEKLAGVWEIQLNMRRPAQFENLQKHGVL